MPGETGPALLTHLPSWALLAPSLKLEPESPFQPLNQPVAPEVSQPEAPDRWSMGASDRARRQPEIPLPPRRSHKQSGIIGARFSSPFSSPRFPFSIFARLRSVQ